MHKSRIIFWQNTIYRGWWMHIKKNTWSSNKFDVELTNMPMVSETTRLKLLMNLDDNSLSEKLEPLLTKHQFTVKPHWYDNEDWDKAEELARQYIDLHFGDAPSY